MKLYKKKTVHLNAISLFYEHLDDILVGASTLKIN